MSIRLMTEVWDKAPYKQSELLILLALADSANDEGVCWPSVPTLARRGRVKDRAVQKALVRLETDGWLSRRERAGRSTIYTVTVPSDTPSHRTPKEPEPVPQDALEPANRPTGRGVPQDRGALEDGGGVSPRTGGGVPQDTQNHKEPPSEPPSSSSSSVEGSSGEPGRVTSGGWRPRFSPSATSVAKMRTVYGHVLNDMALMLIADDLYQWANDEKHKGRPQPSDRMFETFVKNEVERLAKIERDEAKAAREERRPKNPMFE